MAVAALVAAGTTVASGAGTGTVVRGDDFSAAGLGMATINCADPTIPASNRWVAGNEVGPDTAPAGARSLTYAVEKSGSAAGPLFHVDDPSTLTVLSADVHQGVGALSGFALVVLHPTDDPGYWQGLASLGTDTETGWHTVETSSRAFTWRHYDASGSLIGTAGSQTLAQFLPTVGGDGEGAEVGLLYGCNGETFYLDQLTVRTATVDRSWDFEGATSALAATPSKKRVPYGRSLRWDVDLRTAATFESLPIQIEAKYAGRRPKVVDDAVLLSPQSIVQTSPLRSGRYRFVLPDTGNIEGSKSEWQDITVRYVVKGDSTSRRVQQGDRFRVTGTLRPATRGTKVVVQRKSSGGWRNEASTRAGSREGFSLAVPANQSGKQVYRLLAVGTELNGADTSTPFRMTVTAPPSGGGGGGGGGDTGGGGGGDNPPGGPQRPTA